MPRTDSTDGVDAVPTAPKGPVNEGPFDRLVYLGGGRYEFVRIGEPMPVITTKEG